MVKFYLGVVKMFEEDDKNLSSEQKAYFSSVKRSKKILLMIRILYLILVLPLLLIGTYSFIFVYIGSFLFIILFLISLIHKNNIK
ncbi:MAG: hypothetical protein K0Q49_854 [Haloplasmataceae bacterium]|jgi:hypothetical protein|nr:hypothetical protein [Haloplasmataceae bacterium]